MSVFGRQPSLLRSENSLFPEQKFPVSPTKRPFRCDLDVTATAVAPLLTADVATLRLSLFGAANSPFVPDDWDAFGRGDCAKQMPLAGCSGGWTRAFEYCSTTVVDARKMAAPDRAVQSGRGVGRGRERSKRLPWVRRLANTLIRAMPLFICTGYPNVEAENAREAARVFANLRAKSEFGAGGECTCLKRPREALSLFRRSLETIAAQASRPPATSRSQSSLIKRLPSRAIDRAQFHRRRSGGASCADLINANRRERYEAITQAPVRDERFGAGTRARIWDASVGR